MAEARRRARCEGHDPGDVVQPAQVEAAQVIQNQLKQIGIEGEIQPLEARRLRRQLAQEEHGSDGQRQRIPGTTPRPGRSASSSAPPTAAPTSGTSPTAGRRPGDASRRATDEAKAKQLYQDAQKRIVELALLVPGNQDQFAAYTPKVKNCEACRTPLNRRSSRWVWSPDPLHRPAVCRHHPGPVRDLDRRVPDGAADRRHRPDPAGPRGQRSSRSRLRRCARLDRPLPIQFSEWFRQVVRGDLGQSLRSRSGRSPGHRRAVLDDCPAHRFLDADRPVRRLRQRGLGGPRAGRVGLAGARCSP